ncbi:YoaK family protein [Zhongshania guokunii]|uniref:YoaK family protein n=1 Tax=Zhongshania guokunii TaxID=641783 RepID=A0ABV3U552_9GAMM
MFSKLPRWVEYGAFVLAFVAGSVNAIGLLGFKHQSISHLSGTATLVGTGLIEGGFSDTLHLLGILFSFLLGAAITGSVLPSRSLKLGRHYDSLLLAEGVLLLVSIYFLNDGSLLGHYTASAACGLQNGLASTYSGAVVRTTHVTGIFTDLGLMIGAKLRGENFDRRKAILFVLIISGFISGAGLGAYLFNAMQFFALAVPAGICFLLASGYRVYRVAARRKLR